MSQSCCGIERIYVHKSRYDEFMEGALKAVQQYKLGDPMAEGTTMGPLAQVMHTQQRKVPQATHAIQVIIDTHCPIPRRFGTTFTFATGQRQQVPGWAD